MIEISGYRSSIFPPVDSADENGIVAFSRTLNCRMLADAYFHGIFPWPWDENSPIPWMFPPERGVLMPEDFHIPKSLARELKKSDFYLTVDQDFEAVITACAQTPRPGQDATWITPEIIKVYSEFHRLGFAHSFECRTPTGELAGGLYGISIGRIFCGESMFYRLPGASKFALVKAMEIFRQLQIKVIDTQMVTTITALFGAKLIPGSEYLALLNKYRGEPIKAFSLN